MNEDEFYKKFNTKIFLSALPLVLAMIILFRLKVFKEEDIKAEECISHRIFDYSCELERFFTPSTTTLRVIVVLLIALSVYLGFKAYLWYRKNKSSIK